MTLRQYLILMAVDAAISWSAVGLIILRVDPERAPGLIVAAFYASLFLSLAGTFSIIGFALRLWILKKQFFISQQVLIALRQAVLLSLLMVIALMLQRASLLTWWSGPLLVIALTLLELFFISAKISP